ncbi:hypothetical protein [Streptomyces sp. NBC_01446]|uniref:hypothetical protein n=1 Tax=Streptomyces sp. NBC_01446 TaxID=2903870 RepID=UPI0022564809|nr:hypothetical protein [Streptomyces sp. NBC_01446]MCX4647349.1 hypothetical protein [Streptomyces sp. NBC_01446]
MSERCPTTCGASAELFARLWALVRRGDRGRLSYAGQRRSSSTPRGCWPQPPLASPEDIAHLEGFTLHRLRHSALTDGAERGTSTPMLLARSRHASVRSLERYARPGVDAVARHIAERDPAARRRT